MQPEGKAQNPQLYDAIHQAAIDELDHGVRPTDIMVPEGHPVYRYCGYYNNLPAGMDAIRTIHNPLERDGDNRWTGHAPDDVTSGLQGLYVSEASGGLQELDHSLDAPDASERNPEVLLENGQTRLAENLRSMYLLSTAREAHGADLTLRGAGREFLRSVLDRARQEHSELLHMDVDLDTALDDLYRSEDASFDRAVGNAVLESGRYECVRTESVRSTDAHDLNLVFRGATGTGPLDALRPEGRITWYRDAESGRHEPVYTYDDKAYNDLFDADRFEARKQEAVASEPEPRPEKLDPFADVAPALGRAERQISEHRARVERGEAADIPEPEPARPPDRGPHDREDRGEDEREGREDRDREDRDRRDVDRRPKADGLA